MDTFRYVMAVFSLMGIPPALAYWFVIHPFVGFWRRQGTTVTFSFLTVFYLASMAGLYVARNDLLRGDYGTHWGLIAAAVPLMALTSYVQYQRKKQLKFKTLAGLPEIDPEKYDSKLLTEGIYSKIRHPRYVEFVCGMTAWALVINWLTVYVLTGVTFLLLGVIVVFEERELEERFGEEYVAYRERVPRFVPRW